LEEFFPLGDAPEVETIRQRTMHVGARLEREAVAPPTSAPSTEARSIALAIDGGHVKSIRSYQVRTFEVFVAQAKHPCLVLTAAGQQQRVQRVEVGNTWHRNQVVAPEIAAFPFDAAFLVSLARVAELGGKPANASGTP